MWYEIIPPFAIIAGCIVASGLGLRAVDYFACNGKNPRYDIDNFMYQMMERDKKITGSAYKQKAP